jgi:uncharacterized radical SAM superfamily Fe-S cluster-containing enzyme
MDAWNYDQDRVDQCCVHILDKEGHPVSFCEFNAITRPRMTEVSLTSVSESRVGIKVIDA